MIDLKKYSDKELVDLISCIQNEQDKRKEAIRGKAMEAIQTAIKNYIANYGSINFVATNSDEVYQYTNVKEIKFYSEYDEIVLN